MFTTEPYRETDLPFLQTCVAEIQEHERQRVEILKSGTEIKKEYATRVLKQVAANNGVILIARAASLSIGVICDWIETDSDPLIRDDAREHAYISDIFVIKEWRNKDVATSLLRSFEDVMRQKKIHTFANLFQGDKRGSSQSVWQIWI